MEKNIDNLNNADNKVSFKDLSGSLKTIVVISWIIAILYGLGFLIGFIFGTLML